MADKFSPEDISRNVRTTAEATLAKAQDAVGQYMKETDRLFKAAGDSAHAAQAGARDLARQATAHAEANIGAAFDFARQLLHAKDAQEFLTLQREFVEKQAQALGAQMHELGSAAANAGKVKPKA